ATCGELFSVAESCFRKIEYTAYLAFTLQYQGLVLHQIARKRVSAETFKLAQEKFEAASFLFKKHDLLEQQFGAERFAGMVAWEAGNITAGAEQENHYKAARYHMTLAANVMEILRKGRQEEDPVARQSSLDNIATVMEPFLEESF